MEDRYGKPLNNSFFTPIVAPGVKEIWALYNTAGESVTILRNVHATGICTGRACIIHAPSNHRMSSWPLSPRIKLIERLCRHLVGHPDPDSVAYLQQLTGEEEWDIHGCDGCCTKRRPIVYNPPPHKRWWETKPVIDDDF